MTNNNEKMKQTTPEEVVTPLSAEELEDILLTETEGLPDDEAEDMLEPGEMAYSPSLQKALDNAVEEKLPSPDKGRYVSGRRKVLNYGGESRYEKLERTYRSLEAAKSNKKLLEGIIVSATMKTLPNNMEDVLFEVMIKDEDNKYLDGNTVLIRGENMTNILRWDGTAKTKQDILQKRRRFAKAMIDAEIQFYIEKIFLLNPEERDISMLEYSIIGNRIMYNEDLKKIHFDQKNDNSLQVGDIVNGKIIAVSSNKVVYTVAGVDLYLNVNSAYITGLSRVIPRGVTGKKLIDINEDKECLIVNISRDEKTDEINGLRVSFYEPIKGILMKKVEHMKMGSIYSGTVLRYVPPKEEENKPAYLIVKTDTGIEVVCDVPNWKVMPKEFDSVKVKVIGTQVNRASVRGYIKR